MYSMLTPITVTEGIDLEESTVCGSLLFSKLIIMNWYLLICSRRRAHCVCKTAVPLIPKSPPICNHSTKVKGM